MSRIDPREQIVAMSGYHSPQVDVPVRLNTNESPFAPPAAWVESLAGIAASIDWNRYPDRSAAALRAEIAARHGADPAQVFVGNGSNEVLQMILLAFGGAGRTVAMFEPTYQMYAQIARVTGAAVVTGERRADFTLDPAEIERVMSRDTPAVTFLCNPNNPTGVVEPRDNLEVLLQAAPGLVVVDEAYAEFSDWTAAPMVRDDLPLVVTRTFSKTLSLAALRVGYVVAPRRVVEALEVAALPDHRAAVKQAATLAALARTDEMTARVAEIKAQRARISGGLAAVGCEVWPSGANFVLFRPASGDAAAVWQGLLDRGILVRDCSGWPRLAGCLRVTVGTDAENSAFLAAMAELSA
ncbi:MAG: histidinol-phosphate transaminase [Actinomycetota bacterium]